MGKSTLAVALSERESVILADDDIVICEEAGNQRLLANYSGSRLTEKSRELLRLMGREFAAEFPGSDKWIWAGPNWMSPGVNETYPIWVFVILESTSGSFESFERTKDAAAFEALWGQVKFPWMSLPRWRARQFMTIANLANDSAVYRWKRDVEAASPSAMADELLEILTAG